MEKRLKKIALTCLVFISLGVIYVFIQTNTKVPVTDQGKSITPVMANEVKVESIISPDGKFTLKLKGSLVTNTDNTSGATNTVYSGVALQNETLSLPYNTFSPDDKYIFLKKTVNGVSSYPVFYSGGKSFANGLDSLEVVNLFNQKYPNYIITDVTGWAAPTLLIINTDKSDGSIGSSFWFDVGTKSFIQLSTRFN